MKLGVISLFPQYFKAFDDGLVGKAFSQGRASLIIEDLREHGEGPHKTVDDTPYGGGDGMLLKAEPIEKALRNLSKKMEEDIDNIDKYYLCPSGKQWNQADAESLIESKKNIILLCGRYGGADERVLEKYFKRISLGPYILNGGEAGALCIIESLVRLLPGVLGNPDSQIQDSFSKGAGLEAPSYTRPRNWNGHEVPAVLLSGDHAQIKKYRSELSEIKTKNWLESSFKLLGEISKKTKV